MSRPASPNNTLGQEGPATDNKKSFERKFTARSSSTTRLSIPGPISTSGSAGGGSPGSAPLETERGFQDNSSPVQHSYSESSSPTRLTTPHTSEYRRSSDTGNRHSKPYTVARHQPSFSLSRSSSLKAALGRKQALPTIHNIEALLKGKRGSRRHSPSNRHNKERSSSVPTSPTRSNSQSQKVERTDSTVAFQKPTWLDQENSSYSEKEPSPEYSSKLGEPHRDDRGTAQDVNRTLSSGKRRISFGTLPSRPQGDASKDVVPTQAVKPAKNEKGGRTISFGAMPSRPDENPREDLRRREQEEIEDIQPSNGNVSGDESDDGFSVDRSENEQTSNSGRTNRVKAIPRPNLTFTGPTGEKLPPKKIEVHPNTNFSSRKPQDDDDDVSSSSSEYEDMSDIRRAQRLAINQSTIDDSIEHRSIRTIIRGDFSSLQEEAAKGRGRVRTYLVATDLSGEAAYALEWAIGTVLRDGDTLIAVYAVDHEVGTGALPDSETHALRVGEGGAAMQDTQATIGRLTYATKPQQDIQGSTQHEKGSAILNTRNSTKAEQERSHAIEEISQTCIKFLRKTKLQVRVGIEVIHCESPKHMITEAIDELEPTMVIVGSRGQSALKGVLLGSFSNYLVMKSSAPVMVARKKLKTADSKQKATKIRLTNNLSPNKKPLSEARID